MNAIKKDFIVRRTVTELEGKPHVEVYSEEELTRCKDCTYYRYYGLDHEIVSECVIGHCENPDKDWFCADGRK